jgi:uncharacterized protein
MTDSAARIWSGTVWHERRTPVAHRFRHRLWWADLDLERIDETVARSRVLSSSTWRPLRWDRGDHHGNPSVALATATRGLVEARTGTRPDGPVRVLAHLRTWGWCFNPIALYLCHDAAGELSHVVAAVTNTPWKERHQYVLPADPTGVHGLIVPKQLHVSPFMGMDQRYRFDIGIAGDRLTLRITTLDGADEPFAAGVDLTAVPMTDRALLATLARHPMLTHRVSLGIHTQAVRLWHKRVPVHRHPRSSSTPDGARPSQEAMPR